MSLPLSDFPEKSLPSLFMTAGLLFLRKLFESPSIQSNIKARLIPAFPGKAGFKETETHGNSTLRFKNSHRGEKISPCSAF